MKYKVLVQLWGKEVFFFLPDSLKKIGEENTQTELNVGDVAFWPRDPACCIFFGKTPLSTGKTGNRPIAADFCWLPPYMARNLKPSFFYLCRKFSIQLFNYPYI